jgi:outer membrane protein assembly factor BamB
MIRGALRRTGLVLAVAGAVAAIATAGALASPGDQATGYQQDPAHDGFIADAGLAAPLTQAWSITLPAAPSYPLIADGMVFVTANNTLYALNHATGSTIWSHGTGGSVGLSYDGGRIFVVTSGGLLTAFDAASGSIDWSAQLPGQTSFSSGPSATNGIVYVGGAGVGGTLYAIGEDAGDLLWTGGVENGDSSTPAVDAQGVYVSYACQQAYDFDPMDGTPLWHHDSSCEGGGGATPVLADGTIFARDGVLGNIMLDAATGDELGPFNAGPPPAVANDVAFMLSGSTLTAVKDGGQGVNAWQFTGDGHLDTAPLVANGLVFVGSSQGNLYALDAAAGTTSWSTNIGTSMPSGDGFAAANGTLIVPAGNTLSAYRTSGAISDPPANDLLPTIGGHAQPGHLLAADVGIWSGLPSGYTYQWALCNGAGAQCADIDEATDPTYVPTEDEVGSTLRVKVTATNNNGSSSPAESGATEAISGDPPENQDPPSISGDTNVGALLTADPGDWDGNPTSFTYQWFSCDQNFDDCPDISGATDSTYVLQNADADRFIGVEVVAINENGDSDPADSDVIGPVSGGSSEGGGDTPATLTPPTLTGTAQAGKTLTVNEGTWTNDPTGFTYRWYSCDTGLGTCNAIPAAFGSSYQVTSGDVGRRLVAGVVATNDAGPSDEERSNATDPVLPTAPSLQAAPTISGTAEIGQTLTVDHGAWTNNPTGYRYQWKQCDAPVLNCTSLTGENGTTYTPKTTDAGERLVVEVVAVNAGGDSTPADSSGSAVVKSSKAPAAKCHVPKVVGEKLASAKAKIRGADCSVGSITRKSSSSAKRGRVLSQSPKPGETKAHGARVSLKVGKG